MRKSRVIAGVVVGLVLALGALPVVAKDKPTIIESYDANALVQTAGAGSMATINIYRWSSDAERDEILGVIKSATSGDRDVAQALRGQEKAGYAFMSGTGLSAALCARIQDGRRQAADHPGHGSSRLVSGGLYRQYGG